jgi:hypothetical protein
MLFSGMLRRVALVRTDVLERSVLRLLVTVHVVPSSPILVNGGETSSETSVIIRATLRNIPEDRIFLIFNLYTFNVRDSF